MEDIQKLAQDVMDFVGVTELKGRHRQKTYAKIIIYNKLALRGYKHKEIAEQLGAARVSVCHLINQYEDRYQFDKEFKKLVDRYYGNKNQA